MHTHSFPCIVLGSHYDSNLHRYIKSANVVCACGAVGRVRITDNIVDEHVKKKLEREGWTITRRTATCPACTKGPATHGW